MANYGASASCAAGRTLPSSAAVVVAAAPTVAVTAQSTPGPTCAGGKVVASFQYAVAGVTLADGSALELAPLASSLPASTCIVEKQGA